MRLKILHPKGPNHEPEFNRAKAPAQGDLPVLEQRKTVLMVKDRAPAAATHPLGFIIRCPHSPPGTRAVTMTPKPAGKKPGKLPGGRCIMWPNPSELGPQGGTGGHQVHDPEPRRRHFALNATLNVSSQAEIQDRAKYNFLQKEPNHLNCRKLSFISITKM